jgi:hypothetical protein
LSQGFELANYSTKPPVSYRANRPLPGWDFHPQGECTLQGAPEMTESDWSIVLEVFDAAQSTRGEPGHDDRKFLEAIHYFTVHSITWRALPSEYGKWNSVWKRFWRLSRPGVFEAFFQSLGAMQPDGAPGPVPR